MEEIGAWLLGIAVAIVVGSILLAVLIYVVVAGAPALAAAGTAYVLLFLVQRVRQRNALIAPGSRFDGFALSREGSTVSVGVTEAGLSRLFLIGSVIVVGGSAIVGLSTIAALRRWSNMLGNAHVWSVPVGFPEKGEFPPTVSAVLAALLLAGLLVLVERKWPTRERLRKALRSDIDLRLSARSRSWTGVDDLYRADQSLAPSIETLRGGTGDYVAQLDRFLQANASAIVRSPSLLETELRRLVVEAESKQSWFRTAAAAYSASLQMHHATGRTIAVKGNASMFGTLEDVLRILEIARQEFIVSLDLNSFLIEVGDVKEWLAGMDRMAEESVQDPPPPTQPQAPYDVLGVEHDADLSTIKAVYQRLVNIYHEGSSIAPNEAKLKQVIEAYQAIVTTRARSNNAQQPA